MAVVIIPAYKPDETIISITDKLWTYGCRIVVVDDGSGAEYRAKTAAQYFALAFFILCMNNVILAGFTQLAGISVYPAKLLTECMLFCISWLVQNFIIFQKEKGHGLGYKDLVGGQMKE